MEQARKIQKPAKGFRRGGNIRVSIGFEEETFDELQRKADLQETSFGHQVRVMVERGILASEDFEDV